MASENIHFESHTLHKYDEDLNKLLSRMLEMGGLVQQQLIHALEAIENLDSEQATKVLSAEDNVDRHEVEIDRACANIIATRQPAASDLRLILSISKTVRDMERIGDEADKVAQLAMLLIEEHSPSLGTVQIRHVGSQVMQMMQKVLDAYSRFDVSTAMEVARQDKRVDEEYRSAMRELVTYMMEDPRQITHVLNLIWALRALERIGDHVKNIAEQLIYLVKGVDVRHATLQEMEQEVNRPRR